MFRCTIACALAASAPAATSARPHSSALCRMKALPSCELDHAAAAKLPVVRNWSSPMREMSQPTPPEPGLFQYFSVHRRTQGGGILHMCSKCRLVRSLESDTSRTVTQLVPKCSHVTASAFGGSQSVMVPLTLLFVRRYRPPNRSSPVT